MNIRCNLIFVCIYEREFHTSDKIFTVINRFYISGELHSFAVKLSISEVR